MGSTRHPTDWERQRAQLSAYLDGELSQAERADLERHVPTCAECRAELAELRRVRTLLGALPAPAAPRSFALPTGATGVSDRPPAARRASAASPPSAWSRAAQWVGGVAASVGLFLLLGSALLGVLSTGHPSGGNSAASSAPIASGTMQSTPTPPRVVLDPGTVGNPHRTETPATTPTPDLPTPSPTALPSMAPSIQHENGSGGADSTSLAPLASLSGLGLLVSGLIVLAASRLMRPRR